MFVELVRTTTSDGHTLDGALIHPAASSPGRFDLDAVLFLHGVGGNFYAGNLFDYLAKEFVQLGVAALRVNTRGHDTISISWGSTGPVRQGAAYEVVDQCRTDIHTWANFLQEHGHRRIGILGHSLGAIKAIYSQAWEPHPAVHCVAACSPPRLSYSAFMNSDAQPLFFESFAAAREKVEQGQGDTLIQAKFPFPVLITAAGYLDKYGPEERYNILRFIDRVSCPVLVTYGQTELEKGGVAFAGMSDAIPAHRRVGQSIEVLSIPGADHAYTGVYGQLSAAVINWLVDTWPVNPDATF